MPRYIDADELINEFDRTFLGNNPRGVIRATIEKTPTADVRENVRGEWIFHETQNDRYDDMICPFCKKSYTVDAYRIDDIGFTAEDFNFCPNCGADMRK